MTLILTLVGRFGAIQVADRLVTTRRGDSVAEFDALSNKTVLFAPADAAVTMTYTGAAYLSGVPTDQWLARVLRGSDLPIGPDGRPAALAVGSCAPTGTLGQALIRVAASLPAVFQRSTISRGAIPLKIVITGWQLYRRRRCRPILMTITQEPGKSAAVVWHAKRHIGRGEVLLSSEPDGHLLAGELESALERIRVAGIASAEDVFVDVIRTVAARTPLVGHDCMCIVLPSPYLGHAYARFNPSSVRLGRLVSPTAQTTFPVAYSPWVITQRTTMAPAMMGGSEPMETGFGPYNLHVGGTTTPRRPGEPLATLSSQRRPPAPH